MPSSGRLSAALLAGLLPAQLAWSALYIARTSFEHEGVRVFCLWDDAMISMHYARNWVEGWGLVWNPGGERVWGVTNLGVTAVMAGLHLLPLDPTRISLAFQALNALGLAGLLVGVRALARAASDDDRVAAAAVLGTALLAPLQVWSLQGADTGFVALWLVAAGVALARAGDAWPRGLFAWLALGVWLRPDAGLFAAVALVASLSWPGPRLRRVAVGAAWLGGSAAALLLFGWLYYGDPLPNTFYLKATGSPRGLVLRSGLAELLHWPLGLVTAAPLAAAALAQPGRSRVLPLAAGWVAAALAYNVWVGGDWKGEYGSRFVAPALPLLVWLAASGARGLASPLPVLRGPGGRAAVVVGAAVAVALLSSPRRALVDWLDPGSRPMLVRANQRNYAMALYLRDHTRPGASIAVHYGGVPPYFSRRRAVDVLGKSDRHIARLQVDRFIAGHSKWDWNYVLGERRPDLILAASRGLALRPEFREGYYRVRARRGEIRFFVRRDALGVLTDPGIELFDPATGRAVPIADGLDPRRGGRLHSPDLSPAVPR